MLAVIHPESKELLLKPVFDVYWQCGLQQSKYPKDAVLSTYCMAYSLEI